MAKKPETKFKEAVRPLLEKLPHTWVVKIQQVAIRGVPDFLLCVNGHFVAIELKKSSLDQADPLQQFNLDKIRRAGGVAVVMNPENATDVFKHLHELATGQLTVRHPTDAVVEVVNAH